MSPPMTVCMVPCTISYQKENEEKCLLDIMPPITVGIKFGAGTSSMLPRLTQRSHSLSAWLLLLRNQPAAIPSVKQKSSAALLPTQRLRDCAAPNRLGAKINDLNKIEISVSMKDAQKGNVMLQSFKISCNFVSISKRK